MSEGVSGSLPPVSIRPGVGVYATYRRLSYKPWYALAEFVDNSTQNYFDHRNTLKHALKGETPNHLKIDISYDDEASSMTITDNANGIGVGDLTRALALDKPPPTTTGRCEFGMGLKTASCWFGSTLTIRTALLGSGTELTATLHVPDLVERGLEYIPVDAAEVDPSSHYTVIRVGGLYKPIRGRTSGRIKDQLGSMYRVDLRSGEIEIVWRGEPVSFEEAPILEEELPSGEKYRWRKNVAFEVAAENGGSLHVSGWAGLRYPGSQRDAGYALLRRGRVVVGGPGDGYKPVEIFGQGNTFRSQRLVGELSLDDWPVTQAKDAFDWSGGLEDHFIEKLRTHCHDLMEKAEGFRKPDQSVQVTEMQLAAEGTQEVISRPELGRAIQDEMLLPREEQSPGQAASDVQKLRSLSFGPVIYALRSQGLQWNFRLHWQDSISDANWMGLAFPDETTIDIFLNMGHPFFAAYVEKKDFLELIQRIVIALAMAEKMGRSKYPDGRIEVSDLRQYMNRVLRHIGELELKDVT